MVAIEWPWILRVTCEWHPYLCDALASRHGFRLRVENKGVLLALWFGIGHHLASSDAYCSEQAEQIQR